MKTIMMLAAAMLVLGSAAAFADDAGKMPYNGITVLEGSPASSSAPEIRSSYNGVTIFRTGPADFENFNSGGSLPQFADCTLPKTQLSKVGANSSMSCDSVIGSCI